MLLALIKCLIMVSEVKAIMYFQCSIFLSFVFWADQGSKKIERSGLDGSERKVLVDEDLFWPNQMAVSYPTR